MNIGIIGSGYVGAVLAKKLIAVGDNVFIANSRGPGSLTHFAEETGAIPVTTNQVIEKSDVIIIAIPEKSVTELPASLFRKVADKTIVIDAGNYYPTRDGLIPEIENGLTESEWVQQQLNIPVVKAFNNITAKSLEKNQKSKRPGKRIALPICGDNLEAKHIVKELIQRLGYDVLDQGPLTNSWRQQPGSAVYCTNLTLPNLIKEINELGENRSLFVRKEMEDLRDAQRKFYENYLNHKLRLPLSLMAVLFIMIRQQLRKLTK